LARVGIFANICEEYPEKIKSVKINQRWMKKIRIRGTGTQDVEEITASL